MNSRKQHRHMARFRSYDLKCDHLWFYGEPQSQLQRSFVDLMQGDRNHVEISCKISHCRNGKYALAITRIGVHVECICPPQNSFIIQHNSQNVDEDTMFTPSLPPCSTSNVLTDLDAEDPSTCTYIANGLTYVWVLMVMGLI